MELPLNFQLNGRWHIESGRDCVARAGAQIKNLSRRLLVVTGKSGAKKCGALDDFLALFEQADIACQIFDGIKENPHFDDCLRAVESCGGFAPDGVLGIGGGSAMDAAKTIAILLANPGIKPQHLYEASFPNPPLPIFVCDTTAGTGSGVTQYAVLETGQGDQLKKAGYKSPLIVPDICFCDAKYLENLPLQVTLSTAIDIMAHAIEAYFHKKTGVFARMFALTALELLWEPFCRACDRQLTDRDREILMYASQLGGLAIEVTSTCFPHSQGYPITVRYGIAHGFACGYFLGDFLRLHETDYVDDVQKVLGSMGLSHIDQFERKLYSVLPEFVADGPVLDAMAEQGRTYGNLANSIAPTTPDLSRILYENVVRRFKTL